MVKSFTIFLLFFFATLHVCCSGSRLINKENPKLGESVQIQLKDGKELEGVIIATENSLLKYVDTASHRLETLEITEISTLQRSLQIYDLEGNVITEKQISEVKGSGKTIGYGFAGVVLGAAVGFGVGVLIASQSDVPIGYSMGLFGVAGGITMGLMGNKNDREDAIEKVRQERLASAHDELREQLLKEQKLLDEEKKQKEKMMKELDQKKK
jgi:small nuclear ribonucleoprotein (snRNP)-like protein